MNAFIRLSLATATILSLTGCSVVESLFSSAKAQVVAVNRARGDCSVTFHKEGDRRLYVSIAGTPYQEDKCNDIQVGQTVPIVARPIIGDYPYVLFESIVG